ncbi:MAG TPA: hypothetical protein VKA00_03365 [Trueperaceae bacterium]|nr:hypothetical protein [Trueperaceae bacterium]
MTATTVNGERVDVTIIEADGSSGASLTQAERAHVAALDAYLRTQPAFEDAYPGAHLTRVDSNRMIRDGEEGRFYLRYHHERGDTEFWGHLAETPYLDFERGVVAVNASGGDRSAAS